MASYSQNQLVEMAYLYLVEGMIQSDIETKLGLPSGTVSREMKPFGITGRANNEGRGGFGAKGNHCGIASYSRMGFQVTRQDVRDFMFGSGRGMSDSAYFGQMKQRRSQSYDSTPDYEPQNYGGAGAPSDAGGIFAAIVGIIILVIVFRWLGRIGFFAKIGAFFTFILKIVAALAEGTCSIEFAKHALAYRKYIVLAIIALFTVWGFAVMFWGDGLLWGAGIWAIGLIVGFVTLRR